jgi:serine phosphatase RsbU (regulator of sigma subunit)
VDLEARRSVDLTKVLLVEDDAGDALIVEELLAGRTSEFSLVRVRSLGEALQAIGATTDCILLDLGLPDTEGLQGVETVLGLGHRAAVVVLTGYDDRSSGEKALALGAQDYLSKDAVDDESLARALRYAVARKQGEEAARRLTEAELRRAENARLQRGLLPHPLMLNARLSWATRYAAGGGRTLLGGDFFDAVELSDGTVRLLMGDVCGHGPDEAALGVALRVAWRTLVLAEQPVDVTLQALERLLRAERTEDPDMTVFATVCDIAIDADLRRASVHLAGHPGPLAVDADRSWPVPVAHHGPPLGALEHGGVPVANVVDLGEAWTLVLYTDGIIEGRVGPGPDRLGVEGLVDLMDRALAGTAAPGRTRSLGGLADALVTGAELANSGPLTDDVAIVIVSTSSQWRP